MFRHSALAFAALLSCGPMLITVTPEPLVATDAVDARPARRRKLHPSTAPARFRRSRGPAAKPARHRNRLHTSKRVRRRHRRAA